MGASSDRPNGPRAVNGGNGGAYSTESTYTSDASSSNPEQEPLLTTTDRVATSVKSLSRAGSTTNDATGGAVGGRRYIPSRPASAANTAKDVLYRTDSGIPITSLQSQWERPKFSPYLLLPLQFLSLFSLSMTATPRDQFMLHLICKEYTSEHHLPYHPEPTGGEVDPICRTAAVQQSFSAFQQVFTLTIAIPAFFGIALYGRLSDHPRFGRMLFAGADLFGVLIMVSMFLLVHYFELHSSYLLIGSTISGALGGGSMYNAMFYAIASDVTTTEQRSAFFSIADAMLLAGNGIAPLAMSGIVVAFGNLTNVFWIVGVSLTVAMIYLFLLPYHQEFTISQTKTSCLDHFNVFKALTVLYKTTPEYSQYLAPRSALTYAWFVLQLNFTGLFLILIPYTSLLFGWSAVADGVAIFAASATKFGVLLVAVPLITKILSWYHMRSKPCRPCEDEEEQVSLIDCDKLKGIYSGLKVDFSLTRWGLVWYTFCYTLFAICTQEWQFLAVLIIDSFGIVMLPSVRSAMTKMTPPKYYGQFLAAISLLNSLGNVVAPLLFNGIYRMTVSWFPGAALYAMSFLFGTAFLGVVATSISREMVKNHPTAT